MNNHHVLLIPGHGPALVVQCALKKIHVTSFCGLVNTVREDIKEDITWVIFQLYVFQGSSPLVKFTIIHSPGRYSPESADVLRH